MQKIVIGILGFGVVGKGTVQNILERKKEIFSRTGIEIEIKKICSRNLPTKKELNFKNQNLDKKIFTKNANDLLQDKKIEIIIELIGGIDFAKDFIKKALQQGKHVITANKHLLAKYGNELFNLAQKNNRLLLCEASVAGAIPCLKFLRKNCPGGKFSYIEGILNGTANFILSKLQIEGGDFKTVLKQAQKNGFAEKDPTFDIEGIDAAHKIAILSSFVFGGKIDLNAVKIEGISKLIPEDFEFAKINGYKIKLIAKSEKIKNRVFTSVRPVFVKKFSQLGQTDGVLNCVFLNDNFSGPILMKGSGAGGLATGSAILADIIEIAENNLLQSIPFKKSNNLSSGNFKDLFSKTVFRVEAKDGVGILAKIANILAKENISIIGVHNNHPNSKGIVPIFLFLEKAKWEYLEKAAQKINHLSFVQSSPIIFSVSDHE